MSVTLTGTGGLFTRLGHLAYVLFQADAYANSSLPTAYANAIAGLTTEYTIAAPLAVASDSARLTSTQAVFQNLQTCSIAILNKMVSDDAGITDPNDLTANMTELVRQMNANSTSVQSMTVSAAASAVSGNTGNGTILMTTLRGDGTIKQNIFAETTYMVCDVDAQSGSASAGSESFTYYGDSAVPPVDDRWPLGSGQKLAITSIDSLITSANLLSNSSFEAVVAGVVTGWSLQLGTYATDLVADTTNYYRGAQSIKLICATGVLTALTQDFNSATGTSSKLEPGTSYAVCIRHKTDSTVNSGTVTAGVLTVALLDQGNSATADDQSVANTKTITLSGLSTTWTTTTVVFRTPKATPALGYRLRVKITTALTGSNVFVDDVCFAKMTALYAGGPLIAIFSGSTNWINADRYTLTMANNRGTASYGGTFQAFFDRMYGMRDMKLQLPYNASPTVSDSLIV